VIIGAVDVGCDDEASNLRCPSWWSMVVSPNRRDVEEGEGGGLGFGVDCGGTVVGVKRERMKRENEEIRRKIEVGMRVEWGGVVGKMKLVGVVGPTYN
jgi:hypothetical protein